MIDFLTPLKNGVTKYMLRHGLRAMLDPISGYLAFRKGKRVFELINPTKILSFGLIFLIKDADHYAVFLIGNNGQSLTPYNFDISKFVTLSGSTLLVAQSPPDANIHHVGVAGTPAIYDPTIVNYSFPYPYVPETFGKGSPYVWDNGSILAGNLIGDYFPVATGRRHFGLINGCIIFFRTCFRSKTKMFFIPSY